MLVKSKRYKLFCGDNMDVLVGMPDNSVDAVVTDPPYGLSGEPDPYEMMKQWYKTGHYEHGNKRGFMGKEWDAFVPQPAFWKEVFRVLKPGGHVLAFFGTRTHDLGTLAIRLAGFEIRDTIMWVYGSGFPKSLDVSKAIDAHSLTGGSHSRNIKKAINLRPGTTRKTATLPNNGVMSKDRRGSITNDNVATEEAKQYGGWGTSLKPAVEPICLARKPLEGTVAQNVLKHKTGGINIDGCRIPLAGEKDAEAFEFNHNGSNRSSKGQGDNLGAYEGGWKVQKGEKTIPKGRFPANFIHDGHPDVEKGFPNSKAGVETQPRGRGGIWSGRSDTPCGPQYADNGSASRFFYCAKAAKSDRDEGLSGKATGMKIGATGLKTNLKTGRDQISLPRLNQHPTVKPTDLMRYLCRLITPKDGVVLDPFMGSGSTGKAAMREGFRFIGIEMEEPSFQTARERIKHAYQTTPAKKKKLLGD